MKKQYSKWALKALKLAEETARKCSHNYIGTEHILAGLLAVKDSTAGEILSRSRYFIEKIVRAYGKAGSAVFRGAAGRASGLYTKKQKDT